jgi:hypothetical protein
VLPEKQLTILPANFTKYFKNKHITTLSISFCKPWVSSREGGIAFTGIKPKDDRVLGIGECGLKKN